MSELMRCPYCGLLQDEPSGVKACSRCGGGLEVEMQPPPGRQTYLQVQMELDQVAAPAGQNVERYLLVTLRTPQQVPPEEAAPTTTGRLPLNFAAVLDVSGSMQGEKIVQAKEAVRLALKYLHDDDIFSLTTFSNEGQRAFKPTVINNDTRSAVENALQQISAGGMTALCEGLEMGIENAADSKQDTNLVLLLSDGQANVGETDLEKVGQRAFQGRGKGMIVSTIGVGLDYNEALMSEIATQGGGRFYHIQYAGQIPAYLAGELGEAAALAARAVEIQLNIPAGATLVPLSAAYPVHQKDRLATVVVGDIPCDTELELPLRLALLGQPAGSKLSIEGALTFRSPASNVFSIPINRVTVRFLEKKTYQPNEGVVKPVAERVYYQRKAASLLGVLRAMELTPDQAEKQTAAVMTDLSAYAGLLGEEQAEKERFSLREQFSAMSDTPAARKQAAAASYRTMRAVKDFD